MFWPYADNAFEEMGGITINKGIEDGRFWAQTHGEGQHRSRRGNPTQAAAASFQDDDEEGGVLALLISRDEFDKFKDQIAADTRELESAIKTSTSSLQAEMLTMAQSFKGIMAECAATVAADSKAPIAQAVSQAIRDNDGGGNRRGNDRRRNDDRRDNRRSDARRDDTRGPGDLFCFYCEKYGDDGCETRGHCKCGRCGLHPQASEHTTKNCPLRNQADREGTESRTGAIEQAMPELPACLPCDEKPCHAIDAQPAQPKASPSHDEKLQPTDETAVTAALLERTRADALKELALEMTGTMLQNVHKLNDNAATK